MPRMPIPFGKGEGGRGDGGEGREDSQKHNVWLLLFVSEVMLARSYLTMFSARSFRRFWRKHLTAMPMTSYMNWGVIFLKTLSETWMLLDSLLRSGLVITARLTCLFYLCVLFIVAFTMSTVRHKNKAKFLSFLSLGVA